MIKNKSFVVLVIVSAFFMIGSGAFMIADEALNGKHNTNTDITKNTDNETIKTTEDSPILKANKMSFLTTAASYVDAVRYKVNAMSIKIEKTDIAYYIPVSNIESDSCVDLSSGGTSPFGAWGFLFVVVTKTSDSSFNYRFMAKDNTGYYMPLLKENEWKTEDIKNNWTNELLEFPKEGDKIKLDGEEKTIKIVSTTECK